MSVLPLVACSAHKQPLYDGHNEKDRILLSVYVTDIRDEKIDLDSKKFRFRYAAMIVYVANNFLHCFIKVVLVETIRSILVN